MGKAHDTTISDSHPEIYYLPRQDSHACFLVSGEESDELFAKLSAVDFCRKSFYDGQIAQTSMAHVSVIIIRHDLQGIPAYLVLVDTSSAEYLWDCLVDTSAIPGVNS